MSGFIRKTINTQREKPCTLFRYHINIMIVFMQVLHFWVYIASGFIFIATKNSARF